MPDIVGKQPVEMRQFIDVNAQSHNVLREFLPQDAVYLEFVLLVDQKSGIFQKIEAGNDGTNMPVRNGRYQPCQLKAFFQGSPSILVNQNDIFTGWSQLGSAMRADCMNLGGQTGVTPMAFIRENLGGGWLVNC